MLRLYDNIIIIEDESKMCYRVGLGCRTNFMNAKTHVKEIIEKLNKRIVDRETSVDIDRRNRKNSLMDGGQYDIQPQTKRKWSSSSPKSPVSDKDLHAELATTAEILSSARPVSVLGSRGNVKDDPDLYPIPLPHGLKKPIRHTCYEIGLRKSGSISETRQRKLDLHSPDCQDRPPKMTELPIRPSELGFPSPASHSSKSGSYDIKADFVLHLLTVVVACIDVQFTQSGKQLRAAIMQYTLWSAPL
ncbi:hypothetical protein N7489_003940 [Penicillium chrysogenum]|uniref:uncharacterized protein n=1 Tax=Penicillium chrysogenum TaxID=5076 RepID=UPI0023A104C6|nr:uncharacterized protein N7489_003940 [Penicillium chrysogenum]KAJ5243844.1 hypothetical protein N7489_003940 [Penicillium chrysogenum]KAJ5286011.1 hypothetical protein N7524_001317 [Penicillium chrysogenum]KAJ5859691.1 hypothetical protein N7534_004968 [Penicillium rubens]KAJ6140924.1 hypothetical protein N7497_011817 [Penicillium chrysogenum]